MFLSGARNLDAKKDWINELNVFPVPDGDTGTNMTMTIMSAAKEVQALGARPEMKPLCKAISSGSLRGARGNSGVILSQLLRGFTKTIRGAKTINNALIADGCEKAVETAYKAVIKPKEGTILTVAKGMAEKARELADSEGDVEMEEFIKIVIDEGNDVLARTPEMLPVLKEAGVVDSGGQGLMTILEGAYACLIGKEIAVLDEEPGAEGVSAEKEEEPAEEKLKYLYCVEFIIHPSSRMTQAMMDELRTFLFNMGEEFVAVEEKGDVKIHIKTNDPGLTLTKAISYGEISHVTVDNLRFEHHDPLIKDPGEVAKRQAEEKMKQEPKKPVGFIAVSVGDGFREIFEGLNVDRLIEGGQTMNPSTEDVLNAIDQVNAQNIFLFPNNKNIIMAANQARELVQEKNIIVIPTKTVPQGITAIINYAPEKSVVENEQIMKEMIGTVQTAEVTYAVRDTRIDDVDIHKDDIMAVGDDGILAVGSEITATAESAVDKMMEKNPDAELVSIYYGSGFEEADAQKLADAISAKYDSCDVEVNNGGQPVYYCVLSVE